MEDIFQLSQTQLTVFNKPYKRYFFREHDLNRRSIQIRMWGTSFREYIEMSCDIALLAYSRIRTFLR